MPGVSRGQSNEEKYTLVVLGEAHVGKIAIVVRFLQNNFSTEYRRSALGTGERQCVIDGVPATLEILDAAGAEWYTDFQEFTVKESMGFLLVFSVTHRSSFVKIQELHRHVCVIKNHDQFPMIMVGNKSDMDSEREVSVEEAKNLASQLGICYIECSAASGMNIELAFHELLRKVRRFMMSKEQRRTTNRY